MTRPPGGTSGWVAPITVTAPAPVIPFVGPPAPAPAPDPVFIPFVGPPAPVTAPSPSPYDFVGPPAPVTVTAPSPSPYDFVGPPAPVTTTPAPVTVIPFVGPPAPAPIMGTIRPPGGTSGWIEPVTVTAPKPAPSIIPAGYMDAGGHLGPESVTKIPFVGPPAPDSVSILYDGRGLAPGMELLPVGSELWGESEELWRAVQGNEKDLLGAIKLQEEGLSIENKNYADLISNRDLYDSQSFSIYERSYLDYAKDAQGNIASMKGDLDKIYGAESDILAYQGEIKKQYGVSKNPLVAELQRTEASWTGFTDQGRDYVATSKEKSIQLEAEGNILGSAGHALSGNLALLGVGAFDAVSIIVRPVAVYGIAKGLGGIVQDGASFLTLGAIKPSGVTGKMATHIMSDPTAFAVEMIGGIAGGAILGKGLSMGADKLLGPKTVLQEIRGLSVNPVDDMGRLSGVEVTATGTNKIIPRSRGISFATELGEGLVNSPLDDVNKPFTGVVGISNTGDDLARAMKIGDFTPDQAQGLFTPAKPTSLWGKLKNRLGYVPDEFTSQTQFMDDLTRDILPDNPSQDKLFTSKVDAIDDIVYDLDGSTYGKKVKNIATTERGTVGGLDDFKEVGVLEYYENLEGPPSSSNLWESLDPEYSDVMKQDGLGLAEPFDLNVISGVIDDTKGLADDFDTPFLAPEKGPKTAWNYEDVVGDSSASSKIMQEAVLDDVMRDITRNKPGYTPPDVIPAPGWDDMASSKLSQEAVVGDVLRTLQRGDTVSASQVDDLIKFTSGPVSELVPQSFSRVQAINIYQVPGLGSTLGPSLSRFGVISGGLSIIKDPGLLSAPSVALQDSDIVTRSSTSPSFIQDIISGSKPIGPFPVPDIFPPEIKPDFTPVINVVTKPDTTPTIIPVVIPFEDGPPKPPVVTPILINPTKPIQGLDPLNRPTQGRGYRPIISPPIQELITAPIQGQTQGQDFIIPPDFFAPTVTGDYGLPFFFPAMGAFGGRKGAGAGRGGAEVRKHFLGSPFKIEGLGITGPKKKRKRSKRRKKR